MFYFKFHRTCFFKILVPEVKPIAIGIFYRHRNANVLILIDFINQN